MLWFLACHSTSDTSGTSLDTGAPELFERPAATWTAAEVVSQLSAIISQGLPTPKALVASYRELLSQGSGMSCPERNGENLVSYMGCTENGWSWGGITEISDSPQMFMMVADFYAITPSQDTFVGGGRLVSMTGASPDISALHSVAGTWSYPPEGGWLGQGISTSLTMIQGLPANPFLVIQGSYGVGQSYMTFEQVVLGDEYCSNQGYGGYQLRDPSGYWYDVHYSDACDGCVEVFWGDQSLGESCGSLTETLRTALLAAMEGA